MSASIRLPITNIYKKGGYSCGITIGPDASPVNVSLDTGSSALVITEHVYPPRFTEGEIQTNLAQACDYVDGSGWTGAVIKTQLGLGSGSNRITSTGVSVSVAYLATPNTFNDTGGILGLAYAALDDAYGMADQTWNAKYTPDIVKKGHKTSLVPCLMQLANEGLVLEKMAFATRRSMVKTGPNKDNDPANQGVLILGGGEEATDLYSGCFQTAAVLADNCYSTNLKSIIIGDTTIPVASRAGKGNSTNSIIDSGTNSLHLDPVLLNAIIGRLDGNQQNLLWSAMTGTPIPVGTLNLGSGTWPTLIFVLQGISGGVDVVLRVPPENYWQVDAPIPGMALAAITSGQAGSSILGLPLMNNYFTIFDGTAGLGVVKFATPR